MSARVARPARGSLVVKASASRPTWLPGARPPAHLKGTLAGDRGFDPLGLGADADRLKWYAEAEKTNGRWAMAAAAGVLGQEALGLGDWWTAGQKDYGFPIQPQIAILFVTMGFLETKRYQGWKESGKSGFLNSFPFDPAGMNSPDMQEKEIKNGRLAMVAFAGFLVQALVTRQGALDNLTSHLASPFENNIIGSIASLPQTLGN